MPNITQEGLLEAGVHFGHLTSKWNPKMAPYIFMERNGIHLIDLKKTEIKLQEACAAVKQIVKSGRRVMFVATKKQAKDIVAQWAKDTNMPFVTERWLGGMLTNFSTVRKSIKRMQTIDKFTKDPQYDTLSKKEKLMLDRERIKLERVLGGISDLHRLPAALFLVDIRREHIAVAEAIKLNIPTIAMVDTNSDPANIDFPIPANDDAAKSIQYILDCIGESIKEGLEERKLDKAAASEEEEETEEEENARLKAKALEEEEEDKDKGPKKARPRKKAPASR